MVNWDIDKEMRFAISHGVLSATSWALLSNSAMKIPAEKSVQVYEQHQAIEDGEYCYIDLKYMPNACTDPMAIGPSPSIQFQHGNCRPDVMFKPLPPSKTKWIFIYNEETGERIKDFEIYRNRIFFK